MHTYSAPRPAGISAARREQLAALARELSGPFTVDEAARVLGLDRERTAKLLADLAAGGWLGHVRRNLYMALPLEAAGAAWHEDPWLVAAKAFAPCYIGGWSACEHWGLTDQLFRDVAVVSAHRVRERRPVIQETAFHVKVVAAEKLFGTRAVWRGATRVPVSDPSRTVVDLLDDPAFGGGIRHVAEVVTAYFSGDLRDDAVLLDYCERLGNRAVYKRLGYLVEVLDLAAPAVVVACLERESSGVSPLVPRRPAEGPLLGRWKLRLNARVA